MNKKSTKICHLTSVHTRFDTRIYYKELVSLGKVYDDVNLVVADGNGNETTDCGIKIFDVGVSKSRLKRMLSTTRKVYKKALLLDADIYHFHDPELNKVAVKLVKKGKLVISDVHEDAPRQILSKAYIPKIVRPFLSKLTESREDKCSKYFSVIITATDFIRDRFLKNNSNCVSIKNYPILKSMKQDIPWDNKKNRLCYIGALSKVRGVYEMVDSLRFVDSKLNLVGPFDNDGLRDKLCLNEGWKKVIEYGYMKREDAGKILEESKIGFVLLHPTINYKDALPVKMFEYMAAGIPFVITDVPLWREIVEESGSGICIDPFDPEMVANAVNLLLNDDDKARRMGASGRKAVEEKYNWEIEEAKFIKIYRDLEKK
jgi:glycosyltransferase involved in cell wall biosynthesis